MGNEPEDWTQEEVQRFFVRLQSEGGSAEDVAILTRLLEKQVGEGKALLAARARKMN
jgi:hypothetical protein